MKNDSHNPNRICSKCGEAGNCIPIKRPDGQVRYTPQCRKCRNDYVKSLVFNVCQTCGEDKQEDYMRYCKECIKERYLDERMNISGDDLLEIKKWVEKQIRFNFMTDLMGLNELITMFSKISKDVAEFETMSSTKQLDRMWKAVYKFYKEELSKVPDHILVNMTSNRVNRKLSNKIKILSLMTNDEINKIERFLNHTQMIYLDGKEFNLKDEYNLCITGNKTACRRVRKILAILNTDIKMLRVESLKHGRR